MRKKLLSVLLSFVLVLSLAPTVAHAMSFPDVPEDSDYAVAIEYISELKIMVGDTQGNFNPDKIVSRAEMATIICRMLGKTENLTTSNVFTDVPINYWANAYIGQAAALGIVGGYGNGKFGPGDPVTFEQAVTMVIRAIGESNQAISYGGYPGGFIQVAEESNLLEGIQAKQGQGLSRGAVAMLLYNYYLWTPAKPNDGHTHQYIEKTMPGSGTGGHYEDVQRVAYMKTVEDRETRTMYGCGACSFTTYDYAELKAHCPADLSSGAPHAGCRTWSETKKVVVGTHEEPVYETRTIWVDDSTITIRVCALCGQME